jgi:hypothetical protein
VSLFTSAPVPEAGAVRRRRTTAPSDVAATSVASPEAVVPEAIDAGHVLFVVDGTTFAVPIGDVREIARSPRLTRLPVLDHGFGRAVALVDVRGRSVPVVDLRPDGTADGDVLLPLWRRHAGLVVDRVVAVTAPGELVPEPEPPAGVLPAQALGVVRPAIGGDAIIVVSLPPSVEDVSR